MRGFADATSSSPLQRVTAEWRRQRRLSPARWHLRDHPATVAANGFTLIELLVVISLIALLLSLLIPALAASRRLARNMACQTKLRDIGAGMQQYGLNNQDWIVGSPAGSGAYLRSSPAYGPATQVWDFMGPLARLWGIPLPEEYGHEDTKKRFNLLRGPGPFLCPSNDFLSDYCPPGPNAGAGPMVSYNTSRYMLFEDYNRAPSGSGSLVGVRYYANFHEEVLPRDWTPRISRMGNLARKVFAADGSRYATVDVKPDYDLLTLAEWGGAFADVAPYSIWTRSWDRSGASRGFDARVYAFRNSTAPPGSGRGPSAFRMNMVFFDGHVENLTDIQAADPSFWLPARSKLDTSAVYEDVRRHYGLAGTIKID